MDSYSDTARLKLDRILQDLADKADVSAAEEEEGLKRSPDGNDAMPPPTTPSKKGAGRAPRKRRKKETSIEEYTDSSKPTSNVESNTPNANCLEENTPKYILKLFDRSVDMAQFRRDSSMYVMCRAWTQNKPRAMYELGRAKQENLELPEHSEEEDAQFVYSLPGPIKEEFDDTPKVSNVRNVNKAVKLENVIDTFTDISLLKTDNISRWRKTRNNWRDMSLKEQERYSESLVQLKALFTQP